LAPHKRTSKRRAYRFSMLAAAVTFPLLGLAGVLSGIPAKVQILVATAPIGAPIGAHFLFPVPLTADVIDDDSTKTKLRREATYLGASSFVERTATSNRAAARRALAAARRHARTHARRPSRRTCRRPDHLRRLPALQGLRRPGRGSKARSARGVACAEQPAEDRPREHQLNASRQTATMSGAAQTRVKDLLSSEFFAPHEPFWSDLGCGPRMPLKGNA
jgi:hypothetical protein